MLCRKIIKLFFRHFDNIPWAFALLGLILIILLFIAMPAFQFLYNMSDKIPIICLYVIHAIFALVIFLGLIHIIVKFVKPSLPKQMVFTYLSICISIVWFTVVIIAWASSMNRLRLKAEFNLRLLGSEIIEYTKNNNDALPDPNKWYDMVLNYGKNIDQNTFKNPGVSGNKFNYALNENLSDVSFSNLPGNMILLFESMGNWNLHGGEELFSSQKIKHRYCLFNDYSYVLLVDQTVMKYYPGDQTFEIVPQKWDYFLKSDNPRVNSEIRWED